MDGHSSLRQTSSASKLSSIDVSQLDKINAIPNKITDNVLMDGLCPEDQLYLSALMDDDSSEADEDDHTNPSRRMSSAWSPMAQSPMMMMNGSGGKSKRMRRLRPSYAITLSLEDISYIRPSWGLSKGIKRIETKKKTKKQAADYKVETSKGIKTKATTTKKAKEFGVDHDEEDLENGTATREKKKTPPFSAYHVFLFLTMILLTSLMLVSYFVDMSRYKNQIYENKIKIDFSSRTIEIFRTKSDKLPVDDISSIASNKQRLFHVSYGRGIPTKLKSQDCSCEMFQEEADRFNNITYHRTSPVNKTCFACLDWSMRANLQILVTREHDNEPSLPGRGSGLPLDELPGSVVNCYDIKWQSYDSLATPIVDCFRLSNDNERWFGLGDLRTAAWARNGQEYNQSLMITDLASEFIKEGDLSHLVNSHENIRTDSEHLPMGPIRNDVENQGSMNLRNLPFGSYVNFTFFTSNGFFLGDLRSDYKPSVWFTSRLDAESGQKNIKELCLSVSCTERCSKNWSRKESVADWRKQNNLLEYRVCSGVNWRDLVSKLLRHKTRELAVKFINENKNKAIESHTMSGQAPNVADREQATATPSAGLPSSSTLSQQPQSQDPLNEIVPIGPTRRQQSIAEGIGLIDRTIFATSPEFIQSLDGQTLRQFVDDIVKLNLKTSPILLVDSRWQTYVGSLKLNSALFPKAKLLFEILHNKGFKIVMTVKPYIDTQLGIDLVTSLTDSNRLYKVAQSAYKFRTVATSRFAQSSESDVQQSEDNFMFHDQGGLSIDQANIHITRRLSFFGFKNETIIIKDRKASRMPYLHPTKDSTAYCALIDLTEERNRVWMIEMIKRSSWLAQEADGIFMSGSHPDSLEWDEQYRDALRLMIDDLFYKENLYTIPQWTGNFGYMQLAPRPRSWQGLRSTLESILNLGTLGFILVHPGSVWGDFQLPTNLDSMTNNDNLQEEMELAHRWLQLAVFLPILQFKDLSPIGKYALNDQVQSLVKIRKIHVVPEIRRHLPFTPLVGDSKSRQAQALEAASGQQPAPWTPQLPVIRHVWHGLGESGSETIVDDQFFIGTDILVAPVLSVGQRQRDTYLPNGFWRDELRQTNIRGGKWLRNYPIELNEISWFTRVRR